MVTKWDKEFDKVCGASITSRDSDPLEDSGVWDILHGTKCDETMEGTLISKRNSVLYVVTSASIEDDRGLKG